MLTGRIPSQTISSLFWVTWKMQLNTARNQLVARIIPPRPVGICTWTTPTSRTVSDMQHIQLTSLTSRNNTTGQRRTERARVLSLYPSLVCLRSSRSCRFCTAGLYWIDPNGGSKKDAVHVHCDFKNNYSCVKPVHIQVSEITCTGFLVVFCIFVGF